MERSRRNLIRVLNGRLGEETTEALVDFVHQTLEDNNERMYSTHLKNLATKDDLARLELSTREHLAKCATKEDVARLELTTKEQLVKLELSTKEQLAKLELSTKDQMSKLELATKEQLANCATKDDLAKGLANCATKDDLAKGLANCATKDDLADFAKKIDVQAEFSRLELKISDFKSDILRWMFALFLTMMLALLGLYLKK